MRFSLQSIYLTLCLAGVTLAADYAAPTQAAVARDLSSDPLQARDTTTNFGVGAGVTDATIVINGSSYTGGSTTSSSSSSSSSSSASPTTSAGSSSSSSLPDAAATLSFDKQIMLCIISGTVAALVAL